MRCFRPGDGVQAFGAAAGSCFSTPPAPLRGRSASAVGKSPTYTGMYYHKVSSDMQVGAELVHATGKDLGLAFGCQYKLDKDTTVKGKVRDRRLGAVDARPSRRLQLPRAAAAHAAAAAGLSRWCARAASERARTVPLQVDADGMLYSSYKQKISPLATMTLAAQIDTVNLSDNKHKFGLALNITP